ncbi:liver carboxylesterase 1 precursor [Cadophora sp. MPI-SDFR-AT-0126]|nr:liver carboxylesterase 1 precursor [Leotiomycetes sp. MPI-SDFR-AT-0126]
MISINLVLVNFALFACATAAPAAAPTATIADGRVIGTSTSLPNAHIPVNKFLGIPFAKSPPERFAPPTDPVKWTTPLKATSWKPSCIQQFNYPSDVRAETMRIFNNPGYTAPVESEDCLYLNVYAPSSATKASNLPVMVWIYGGNLAFGAAGVESYDGSSFAANQNVVVVTLNYRTNAFGFSASPELPTGQQNAGFLDQRKALTWVQTNIQAFGGDPSKVTIFGESAGGLSVKQLVALPPSPVPFRAAILESTGGSFPLSPEDSWNQLVKSTRCTNAASQIGCVRQVPANQIKNIIEQNSIGFGPVEDGVTYTANTRAKFFARTAADVPLLHGTNSNEGRVFAHLVGIGNGTPQPTGYSKAILAFYPTELANIPFELISQIITDLIFTCTTSSLTTVTALNGYDTWRYYYEGVFPNLQVFEDAGAFHASEIPQVFGNYFTLGATTQQIGLSKYIQTAWANFAKEPQKGPGWPKLGGNFGLELGTLGRNGGSGEVTIPLISVDVVCAIYAPIIALQPL